MGIFDRIEDVIKSYLNSEDDRVFGSRSGGSFNARGGRSGDPDVEAAFDELNEFLNRGKSPPEDDTYENWGAAGPARGAGARRKESGAGHTRTGSRSGAGDTHGNRGSASAVPETLRADFAELGLPFGAPAEDCKAAYKKLLKTHHPDRHAGHEGNMRKATEKSARINAAFDRIERWRQTGRAE
jgi:curved DNA-binding protein CbpA